MKLFMLPGWRICTTFLLAVVLYGCSGGASKPQRKKMPELNNLGGDAISFAGDATGLLNLPFQARYVDAMSGGKATSFLAVQLPDAGYDSMALSLAQTYQPLALPLLTQWAQQEGKGLMLDLRNNSNAEGQRSDYVVEGTSFALPVVILSDRRSAQRIPSFLDLVKALPGLKIRHIADSELSNGVRHDCFSNTAVQR